MRAAVLPETGTASGGLDRQRLRAFRAARRHSWLVWLLRLAIPAGSAVFLAVSVASGLIRPFQTAVPGVEVGRVTLSGSKIMMDLPKLTGFKRDNRPYEVTAETAAQDPRRPNMIELTKLKARLELQDGGKASLSADLGDYDSTLERLDMRQTVHVITDSGYDIKTSAAVIEFKSGRVIVDKPVDVIMKGGTVKAGRMDVFDNGKKIVFEGEVKSVLHNTGKDSDAGPETDAKPASQTEAKP